MIYLFFFNTDSFLNDFLLVQELILGMMDLAIAVEWNEHGCCGITFGACSASNFGLDLERL